MTMDQYIALAASIAACFAAMATFWTVYQMKRQREASYRPELALSRVIFDASSPIRAGSLPTHWKKVSAGESENDKSGWFCLPLSNIGLGAARNVLVSWSFPFETIVTEANNMAQRSLTAAYFSFERGALSLKSDALGSTTSMWINQQTATLDYVLPASVRREPIILTLPHAYILATSALIFLAFAKQQGSFPAMPKLRAKFEYEDIGNGKHEAIFEIGLELISAAGSGESFHAYLEARKCG